MRGAIHSRLPSCFCPKPSQLRLLARCHAARPAAPHACTCAAAAITKNPAPCTHREHVCERLLARRELRLALLHLARARDLGGLRGWVCVITNQHAPGFYFRSQPPAAGPRQSVTGAAEPPLLLPPQLPFELCKPAAHPHVLQRRLKLGLVARALVARRGRRDERAGRGAQPLRRALERLGGLGGAWVQLVSISVCCPLYCSDKCCSCGKLDSL